MSLGPAPREEDGWPAGALRLFLRDVLGNVVLLLLLLGAERLFFDKGFFSSLVQHPFWIVVLIAAVQDGLFVGVAVAVAATLLMDWPPRPAEADITAHYIQVAMLPLQWLLAALCIGLFRTAELRRSKETRAEIARLNEVNEVLAAETVRLEQHMASAQLEALSRDETPDEVSPMMARILALQEAELATLRQLFDGVAGLVTPLPACILVMTADGDLEPLDPEQASTPPFSEPPFSHEQLQMLRTMPEVVIHRAAPFERKGEFKFMVLVGVKSPDRRTLHGAVALLAPNRKAANGAIGTARFLSAQLGPVLTRLRAPKIAAPLDTDPGSDRVRKLAHG